MNKILTIAAVLTAIATPAFAQSYDPDIGSGNIAPSYAMTTQAGVNEGARSAFARVSPRASETRSLTSTDPDPNIRFQLHRESEQGEW
jgi:hypothetical protein